jgi:sugar lactone lactonase YvrE
MRMGVAAGVLCALASAVGPAGAQDRAELQRALDKARAAHDARDLPGFLEWSRKVVALAPRSTRALYNLACAHALGGDAAPAAAILARLTTMGVSNDASRDPDFDPIRKSPEFEAALDRAKGLESPVGSSEVAFRLPEKDLITEAVAYDPKTRAFFVSSVRKRKVVRRGADGSVADFTKAADGLLSAVGLAVDPTRRRLWVTTAGFPQMEGFKKEDQGRSLLVEYDLDTGALRRRIAPPVAVDRAELSDVAVSGAGDVYVSDPVNGGVYVLGPGATELRVLVAGGVIGSAQGLAPSPDGNLLFVADYTQGIVRVNTSSGAALLLPSPADAAVTGIDGLALHGGSLIGVQNGVRPHRIVRLVLDPERAAITGVETLVRHHPDFDEPTLGTIVEGAFHYVANSQYARVRDDGTLEADQLRPPTVLRLVLER